LNGAVCVGCACAALTACDDDDAAALGDLLLGVFGFSGEANISLKSTLSLRAGVVSRGAKSGEPRSSSPPTYDYLLDNDAGVFGEPWWAMSDAFDGVVDPATDFLPNVALLPISFYACEAAVSRS
jgi:hypothetical protein